jgi:hypothetical protein
MSKYDNLFNKPRQVETVKRTNSFITVTPVVENTSHFDYKDNLFPELSISKASISTKANETKKYADITAIINDKKMVTDVNPVPAGWIQYSKSMIKKNCIFDVRYGEKTKRQLEQERHDTLVNESMYIHNQMISALANNWNRYKTQYDAIHGEGAYDLLHYTESIYSDDNLSDDEKDNHRYSGDEYEYDCDYDYTSKKF